MVGGREVDFEMQGQTVAALRKELEDKHPALKGLRSLFIAVNGEYAEDAQSINANDEIALIPPVSGG